MNPHMATRPKATITRIDNIVLTIPTSFTPRTFIYVNTSYHQCLYGKFTYTSDIPSRCSVPACQYNIKCIVDVYGDSSPPSCLETPELRQRLPAPTCNNHLPEVCTEPNSEATRPKGSPHTKGSTQSMIIVSPGPHSGIISSIP